MGFKGKDFGGMFKEFYPLLHFGISRKTIHAYLACAYTVFLAPLHAFFIQDDVSCSSHTTIHTLRFATGGRDNPEIGILAL